MIKVFECIGIHDKGKMILTNKIWIVAINLKGCLDKRIFTPIIQLTNKLNKVQILEDLRGILEVKYKGNIFAVDKN